MPTLERLLSEHALELLRRMPLDERRITPPSESAPFAVLRIPPQFYEALGSPTRVVIVLDSENKLIYIVPRNVDGGADDGSAGKE